MVANFIIQFLIAVAMTIVSYILQPKPKAPKPDAAKQLDDPQAEAGLEITKLWGTMIVKDANCLWFGEKNSHNYEVKA